MNSKIYNKLSAILVMLIAAGPVQSQVILTGDQYISNPAGIITDVVKAEFVTSPSQIAGLAANDKIRTYKYVDGFGRPLQEIAEGASPNNKDLIQIYQYDEFGRSTKQFMPFEYVSSSTGAPYQDRPIAVANQAGFYTYGTVGNKIAADSKPWVQSEVEQSPMQRLLKQGNIGDGFQTDQHYKSMNYRVNDANDAVRKWNFDGTSSSTYTAGDLSVTEGFDENGTKGLVFTDKIGKVVLKRQQADETISGTLYPWFDTYYIYNAIGNISWIITPKAVAKLNSLGGTWNITSVPEIIYAYKYDSKNRVTEKKVPGAAVTYMVYDPLNRVVLAQSGKMRSSNKWFYSKYDAQGRVVIEGVYTHNANLSQTAMQSFVNTQNCYAANSTTYYEDRTPSTSSYYTDNCFPKATDGNGTEERIYYHYDDYDYMNLGGGTYLGGAYIPEGLPGEATSVDKVLGLNTVVRKKILGSSNWSTSYTYYDKRYNVIQVQVYQSFLNNSRFTSVTDFGGRTNERKVVHTLGKNNTLTIRNSYSFDKMNRLKEVKEGLNGGTMLIVGRYEYNPLGQLVDKKLHSTNNGTSFLQSVDYRYSIRGQLISINNSTLANDGGQTNDETNDLWGMNLLYNQTDATLGNTANWTGMLSAVKWKASITGGNTDERSYRFNYDKLYRLTGATYAAKATNGTWTKYSNGFNENITYDWNGNILTMQRNAVISNTVTAIDNMSYNYGTGNDNDRLQNMAEASSNSYGYRNFTGSSNGYAYDENGNLVTDNKKGITITYNEMNKPLVITQTATGKTVTFTYDAAGVRFSKAVYNGSTTTTEYYIDGGLVTDQNKVIKYFAMAEGRVRKSGSTYTYEYFFTDHQGNVRLSFEDNGSGTAVARQENSYYPYGMLMAGNYMPTDANKRLYNAGSMWQDDFGGIVDYYSTFFREYDPVLGRFNGVDPRAEASIEISVYHYAGNNPVNFNDPLGDLLTTSVGKYYIDSHGNKWHGPSPLQGTGFGYMEVDWINGTVTVDDINGGSTYFIGSANSMSSADILGLVVKHYTNSWEGTDRTKIRSQFSGGIHSGEGVNVTYVVNSASDIVFGSMFLSFTDIGRVLGGEIWFYGYEMGGTGHSLVWRYETNVIYEINYPNYGTGGTLETVLKDSREKTQAYIWRMNNPYVANTFWGFRGNRGNVKLGPVFVSNPSGAVNYFEKKPTDFEYNFFQSNCKNYAIGGLNKGGANLPLTGPLPAAFVGDYILQWNVGDSHPKALILPRPFQRDIMPSPFLN